MLERSNPEGLSEVLDRNIHALVEHRRRRARAQPLSERAAGRVTAFTGSLAFVALHALLVGGWIIINLGIIPGVRPFDPFPFVMLAMIASVEAIFLSTFVLITQNRMQRLADERAELDLQISLLSEHEITRLVALVDAIATRVGVEADRAADIPDLKKDIVPEKVMEAIEQAERSGAP